MKNTRLILAFLLLSFLLFGNELFPIDNSNIASPNEDTIGIPEMIDNLNGVDGIVDTFSPSQDTQEGVISPIQITESGFKETDPVRARTDTGTDTIQNITIDDDNNWVANYTSIEVSNIKRLYGVNGTFENGVEPWTNYTVAGGTDVQIADYDADGEYIICRNVGDYKWQSKHTWVHYAGSEVGFEQEVNNTNGELEFDLRYDFRYATGPIDPEGDNALPAVVGAFYQVNYPSGDLYSGYYYPMNEYLLSREAWYSVAHTFTIPAAWSQFSFAVGLYLAGSITLDNVTDYDDDPLALADGTENAQNLTLYIDNVEFTGVTVPTFENVELTFHADTFSDAITGSGIGTASISNPDYWTVDPLEIQITSNTTVAFTYSVTTLYLRSTNSSWTTYLSYQGVSYSIDAGQNADLEYYTYVTTSSGYENQTIDIGFPKDWENTTIWDPLQNDITGLCSVSTGRIFIPTSLFTRVGWWKITHQSLNYAKSIDIQIWDSSDWTTGSLFRTGNLTRTLVELGTLSETPGSGSSVTINWIMPNGTVWFADSISSIVSGVVTSSQLTFGGTNTTAGQWEVQVIWNNGTELAYGVDTFDLYHQAFASAQYPSIETDYGFTISNQIILTDDDSGQYLLDDSVSMSANWSSSTVDFIPNFAKNWWQADFDTSELENGEYTVIVDITRPYFDPISIQFTVISTFETSLTITNAGPGTEENDLFSPFTVLLTYELWNGTGIEGAQATVTHTGPQEGIQSTAFTDLGSGLYSIDIISNISTTYEITITFSKSYHYNSSDSFTLAINEISTELVLVNGTADIVQFGDSYRLVLEYRNSTGYGLTDATLQVVTITPSSGLLNGSFTHISDGLYEITFTPTSTGTYAIVISADVFNHEMAYATFTLTGVVIPSVLTSIPSSVSIAVNETFVLQLSFEDESSNPINSATIQLLGSPSGIWVSPATPVGGGIYNITIRSSEINIYNLLFRASATNYQSSIVGFTVSVTALYTTLDITNAGAIPEETGLNEVFTVFLSYELLNGTGVPGALPSLIFTGPAEGLHWNNFVDNNNGIYSIDITCNVSATYGISITMSKPYYYNTTDSFTLIVGETGSELELLNGTADVVLFGNSYRLVIEYRNSTGFGLAGADVSVISVTPATGLGYTNFTPISGGYYEITLTPSAAGTFSIVIGADIINHESQYTTFTLTASGIPTILTSLPSEYTVAINQTFVLQLRFMDEGLNPIDGATVTLLSPPAGLSASAVVPAGNGYYNITLQSSLIQTFDLLFRATANNYQSSSAGFTFVVTEIQTTLRFAGDVSSTLVEFAEPYNLVIYYESISPNQAVQDANITILPDVPELDIYVTEYTGYYIVTIRGFGIGSWTLSIVSDKANYRFASKSFVIEVQEIDTAIEGSSPLETLLIGRSYTFTFDFIFESNSSNIHDATISPSGAGADWINYIELGTGQYAVNLTPQELGEHSVTLSFEKLGFDTAVFRLSFEVGRIPIVIEVLQGLTGPENSESVVTIRITESDTGNSVTGLEVFCYIVDSNGARGGRSFALTEIETLGDYSGVIMMPVAEGDFLLLVECNGENYVMNSEFTTALSPARNVATMLWITTTRYYPVLIGLVAVCAGLVYRRSARKKRIRENKETLAVKRRFDDIRNLLGVIVLHKDSGLPVYSKILREGLEETVISAFITAITSFRGEFDIESSSEEWGLIPISDIVRVVSTNKLVCAFITTGNPSPEQRERMIQFAKQVGFIFDETMEDVPVVVLDRHTTAQFDTLFEDLLDGQLLRTFKLDETKKFPTTTCANERIARKHGEEFKLEELATELAGCGLEEGRVYKAIMVALENHFLVTTDDSPFATELLRASDVVVEEG